MVMRDEENEKNHKGSSKLATEGFTLVATAMVANSFKTKWLVDTRAFHHMTYDWSLFTKYKAIDSLPNVETSNGIVHPVGIGIVIINVENTIGEIGPLRLRETYHLPSLLVNLFSRTFIRRSNAYVCGKTDTIRLCNPDEEIAAIDIINENLFVRQPQQLYMPTTAISRVYPSLSELIKL
jgi:hypothetical protein